MLFLIEKSDAPRQPEITEVKKDSISLKWLAPEKDGGSLLSRFVLQFLLQVHVYKNL
jgi:hypothetical protein